MGKTKFFFIAALTISLFFLINYRNNAQNSKEIEKLKGNVIAKVGNEKITFGDLEKAYKKNMTRKDSYLFNIPEDSVYDFLNLFVNYRLKVMDAVNRGFDKDSSVIQDLINNRRMLAESFYYDKILVEPNVDKLLKLRDKELQIAIITVNFPPVANPDTTAAYQKAMNILKLLKTGADFTRIAMDSSSDKESAKKGGIIPTYITAGNVQKHIEKIIFSLKPGEIYPEPINTKFGYLIVKILKNVPRVLVKASHILISVGTDKDTAAAAKKADSLLSLIKKGVDFAKLAEENSDDPASQLKGGVLTGWYSRSTGFDGTGRYLVPDFVDVLYSLKDGGVSGVVRTDYGYHIIRRDSTRNFDPEIEREEAKKTYKRIYFEQDKRILLDSLRLIYGFKVYEPVLKEMLSVLDTSKNNLDSAWAGRIPDKIMNQNLYSLSNQGHKVSEYVELSKTKSNLRGMNLNTDGIYKTIDRITDPMVFDKASENLEKDYPEFATLMNEFRDGILLFKVAALEIWDKLKFDTTMARAYYDSSKSRYKTVPLYGISEIYVLSDSLAKSLYDQIKDGADFGELAVKNTQRAGYREKKGEYTKVTAKDNKLVQMLINSNAKPGDILHPLPYEKGYSIIKFNSFEDTRPKTFEEAIPDFAPEVQEILQKQLEDKWIVSLKKQFGVKIDRDELDKTIEKMKNSH